jgi:hypothetical protein
MHSATARAAVCQCARSGCGRPMCRMRLSPRQRDNAADIVVPASTQQPDNEGGPEVVVITILVYVATDEPQEDLQGSLVHRQPVQPC